LDPDEIGRVEFEPDHIEIILKKPKNYSSDHNLLFKVTSIGIYLYSKKLIVVIPEDIQIFEAKQSFKLTSMNDVLIKIIYGAIFHFLGHLKVINMISDSIEKNLDASFDSKYLLNIYTLEKSLVYYITGINSNAGVIDKLKMFANRIGFSTENIELIDDMIIENNQCKKLAETYSHVLSVMITTRDSIVNSKLNNIMKKLTVAMVIFIIPTLLTGLFGMSEFTLMIGEQHKYLGFFLFGSGLIVLSAVTYFVFKWRKWM